MAYDLIIGTTKIISGQTLTESFVDKLGWLVICCIFIFAFIYLKFFIFFFPTTKSWTRGMCYNFKMTMLSWFVFGWQSLCISIIIITIIGAAFLFF